MIRFADQIQSLIKQFNKNIITFYQGLTNSANLV